REPGPIPEFLAAARDGRLVLELIADGVHLAPSFVRNVFELVGRENVVLVTDAMAAAGMADGAYQLGSLAVTVTDGVARLTHGGAIAGGTAHLLDVVRTTVAGGVHLVAAVHAAATGAAVVLGDDAVGALETGRRADVLVTDNELRPVEVVRNGVSVGCGRTSVGAWRPPRTRSRARPGKEAAGRRSGTPSPTPRDGWSAGTPVTSPPTTTTGGARTSRCCRRWACRPTGCRSRGRGCSPPAAARSTPRASPSTATCSTSCAPGGSPPSSRCTTGTCRRSSRTPAAGRTGRPPTPSPSTPGSWPVSWATGWRCGSPSTSRGARRSSATPPASTHRAAPSRVPRSPRRTTSTSPTGWRAGPAGPSSVTTHPSRWRSASASPARWPPSPAPTSRPWPRSTPSATTSSAGRCSTAATPRDCCATPRTSPTGPSSARVTSRPPGSGSTSSG